MLKMKCLLIYEVLPQVAVMAKPAIVTIAEFSHPSLNDGAIKKLIPVVSAGRWLPVDQMGEASPWNATGSIGFVRIRVGK